MNILILTIILLIYTNLIRYLELKDNTTMYTWKQYWINKVGINYSFNIIIISFIIYLLTK